VAVTVFHVKPLKRPVRRATLVVHVAASAGWLGLTLGLLALALAAYTTQSASLVEACYRSMKVFTDWLVLPMALLTLFSGLLLSLGTRWGLARHRWVITKFWLTLATVAASVTLLRPGVSRAAEAVTRRVTDRLCLHDRDLRPQALGPDPARPPDAGPGQFDKSGGRAINASDSLIPCRHPCPNSPSGV
jgi:uncharacterized membrane protein